MFGKENVKPPVQVQAQTKVEAEDQEMKSE
jgi:hypothetical protein